MAFAPLLSSALPLHDRPTAGLPLPPLPFAARGFISLPLDSVALAPPEFLASLSESRLQAPAPTEQPCSHVEARAEEPLDGHCWLCLSEVSGVKARRSLPDLGHLPPPSSPFMPLSNGRSSSSLGTTASRGSRKSVRFQEFATVTETWSKEEYPSRSMYAPDLEEDKEAARARANRRSPSPLESDATVTVDNIFSRIAKMAMAREKDYPDLQAYQ